MTRSLWPWSRTPELPPSQPHSLSLKAWPPEIKGEGLGIVGIIMILMMIIAASAAGVPLAAAIVKGAEGAIEKPAQMSVPSRPRT